MNSSNAREKDLKDSLDRLADVILDVLDNADDVPTYLKKERPTEFQPKELLNIEELRKEFAEKPDLQKPKTTNF